MTTSVFQQQQNILEMKDARTSQTPFRIPA